METSAKTAMNVNEIFMAIGPLLFFDAADCICRHLASLRSLALYLYFIHLAIMYLTHAAKKLPKNEPARAAGGQFHEFQEATIGGKALFLLSMIVFDNLTHCSRVSYTNCLLGRHDC